MQAKGNAKTRLQNVQEASECPLKWRAQLVVLESNLTFQVHLLFYSDQNVYSDNFKIRPCAYHCFVPTQMLQQGTSIFLP